MHPIRLIIPLVIIAIFFAYIIYMVATKKDPAKIKQVLLPGLFFISVWLVIYVLILK